MPANRTVLPSRALSLSLSPSHRRTLNIGASGRPAPKLTKRRGDGGGSHS